MRSLKFEKYGDYNVLKVTKQDIPQIKNDEYLIKIHSSSLTTAEAMMRRARPFAVRFFLGLRIPKHNTSGACYSGVVIQDGSRVLKKEQQFAIFGETGEKLGTNADYIKVKKNSILLKKPENISFEEASCFWDGTITSYYFLTKIINTKPNQSILINGGTGSLGIAAIQIAKILNLKVTVICSEKNFPIVKDLGAIDCLSYEEPNYLNAFKKFDYIFDCVGRIPYRQVNQILKNGGQYLTPVVSSKILLRQMMNLITNKKFIFTAVGLIQKTHLLNYAEEIIKLVDAKKLSIPITKIYTFETVVEAHRIIDSGHKTGNFVLNHN